MQTRTSLLIAGLALIPSSLLAQAQIPAFPGADGAAANVTGGRGGSVYHVTKLDASFSDNAAGTLRFGLNNANFPAGPRTIVFDVGGRINLGRVVSGWDPNGNGWDTQSRLDIPSNVTVAGQTAPGGIRIMGGVVKPSGSNIILRNITFAPGYGTKNFSDPGKTPTPGDYPDSTTYDALDISGNNIMIDHVTTVYATDETISMNENASNITVQYSNISQGQNYPQADAEAAGVVYTGHALGSLLQAGTDAKVSVHHNLYAHLKGRLPRVGSEVGTGAFNDFRNNVFYNWLGTGGGGASGQPSFSNFINNFYLAGNGGDDASGNADPSIKQSPGGTGIFDGQSAADTRVFAAGNMKDINNDGDANDAVATTVGSGTTTDFRRVTVAAGAYAVPYTGVTDTTAAAYGRVLDYAGANWWDRAAIDQRIINEVRTGTGKIRAWADDPFNNDPTEGVEWRSLVNAPSQSRAANFDTDADGMPDAWETAHKLNPAAADNNGDFDSDGYTNLEEYLNEIAAWPAPKPAAFNGAIDGRFENANNWDTKWQPSRYDEAQINAGNVTLNSVGQHARVLQVSNATFTAADGWLDVAEAVRIGPAGTYNLAGGTLSTPLLMRITSTGTFNFTGGILHADNIAFDFINNGGKLAPGNSVGHTHVAGDLQLLAGSLDIELASPDIFDTVLVDGKITLGGQLDVSTLAGYIPAAGERYLIVSATTILGSFDSVTPGYQAVTTAGNVYLVAVPEPASAAIASAAATGALAARRRVK